MLFRSLVVSGKEGTYALDKNDTVIAGTNLGKSTPSPDNNLSTDELRAIRTILRDTLAINKDILTYTKISTPTTMIGATLGMGISELGTAVNVNTYKVQ